MKEKIEKIINDIVYDTYTERYENPNGSISYTCPFCGKYKTSYGGYVSISELEHDKDCTYILAKEIEKETNKD